MKIVRLAFSSTLSSKTYGSIAFLTPKIRFNIVDDCVFQSRKSLLPFAYWAGEEEFRTIHWLPIAFSPCPDCRMKTASELAWIEFRMPLLRIYLCISMIEPRSDESKRIHL
jgi:hypothetical protein